MVSRQFPKIEFVACFMSIGHYVYMYPIIIYVWFGKLNKLKTALNAIRLSVSPVYNNECFVMTANVVHCF